MFLPVTAAAPLGAVVTSGNLGWDLKGNDGNNDLPTDSHVVYFKLQGLGEEDFLRLDSILDPLMGRTTPKGNSEVGPNGILLTRGLFIFTSPTNSHRPIRFDEPHAGGSFALLDKLLKNLAQAPMWALQSFHQGVWVRDEGCLSEHG